MTAHVPASTGAVGLYWLPLGADGNPIVRRSGSLYEVLVARHQHRVAQQLFHSALQVQVDGDVYTIEMTPVWGNDDAERGVVGEGAVGLPWLGRWAWFRYELRRWRGGRIPDIEAAVGSPVRLSQDSAQAREVLDLVPACPRPTWGLDELGTGEMWNSNSLIAWLLASSGHDLAGVGPPAGGRAPGWTAGLVVAERHVRQA